MITRFMPIDNSSDFTNYGFPGLVVAALLAFLYYLLKEHKAERQEWISAYRDQSRLMDTRQSETNNVIRELVAVVRESNGHRHYRHDD